MQLDSSLIVIYLAIPVIIGIMGFMFKTGITSMLNRLDALEVREQEKLTRVDFEIAMKDKLDPLKQGVEEMKEKVDKVYDILLRK